MRAWLKENTPTKYSRCSYIPWNVQGKYRDSLCSEFIREILHSLKGTRCHDPRDPFQANVTAKTHFTVCVNEHKHFYKSHKQFTQLLSIERLFFILHHFAKLFRWGKAPVSSAESPPLGLGWRINPRQLIARPCRGNRRPSGTAQSQRDVTATNLDDVRWYPYPVPSFIPRQSGGFVLFNHFPHVAPCTDQRAYLEEHHFTPKEELPVLYQNPARCLQYSLSPASPTAAAAWLGHGNGLFALEGTQFPRHLRLQPKESMDGRSRFSRATALKLNINDSREEEGMKWFTSVFSSQVAGARLFFWKGGRSIPLPDQAASDTFNLSTSYSGFAAQPSGWKVNNFPASPLRVLRS